MNFEQRANINICFRLGRTAAETIYKWFKWRKEGREDLNNDERSAWPRSAVNEENVEIVGEFIKKKQKYSLH